MSSSSSSTEPRSGRWAALSAQHQAEAAQASQSDNNTSRSPYARPVRYQDGTFSITKSFDSSMSPLEVVNQERKKEKLEKQRLSAAEVGMVNKRAQMEALMTGVLSAGALYVASRRILRLSPNVTLLVSLGGGCFVGFLESRTILSRGMTSLMYAKGIHPQQQEALPSQQPEKQPQDDSSSEFLKE